MKTLNKARVIVTRPRSSTGDFTQRLQQLGAEVQEVPSINIRNNPEIGRYVPYLKKISSYDWIIFTSVNGVRFFFKELETLKLQASFKNIHIGAVGPQTATELLKYSLKAEFIPTQFETKYIIKELQNIKGKRILIPRASIASNELQEGLRKKGAIVDVVPIYTTNMDSETSNNLYELLNDENTYITFTSSSTVRGFIAKLQDETVKNNALIRKVVSIGPVTSETAKEYGFKNIFTSQTYTTGGIIDTLIRIHNKT